LNYFVTRSLDDANDPSIKWLEWLEGSLKWEVRSLFIAVVGVPMMVVYSRAGVFIVGLGFAVIFVMVRSCSTSIYNACIVNQGLVFKGRHPVHVALLPLPPSLPPCTLFVQDTAFSAVVTVLFLRPIYKILREGGVGVHRSAGYKSLMKTKWMTLSGATLAVLSSTALYINVVLGSMLGGTWSSSPYLYYAVFGMNLDSVLNDLGMLLACGVLKTASCAALIKHFSTAPSHAVTPVAVLPQPAFDSQAYEKDYSDSD
jgi:hypothetical protein